MSDLSNQPHALVRYDAARHAVQVAHSVDEVKDIRDKALALAAYARQANDNDMLAWVTEIRVRAERRAGEMLIEMPKANGGEHGGKSKIDGSRNEPSNPTPTLADLGVSKNQSSRWQKLAAVPQTQFEEAVTAAKEIAGEVTASFVLKKLEQPHVSHNSGNNEWYTPREYIEAARRVMGSIDVDPASSEIANKIVCAKTFYTAETDGRYQSWNGNVWMNPPYAQPLILDFCETLVGKLGDEIKSACVLVNNATETAWFSLLAENCDAICFVKGRIRFIDMDGKPSGAPLQGQAILYFGGKLTTFSECFQRFGYVFTR